MKVRLIEPTDAAEVSNFLQELVALGKRVSPADQGFVMAQYVSHPDNIQCVVVEDADGNILGLQVLKRAEADNIYGVTPGWGIIGTHVRPSAARRGVGKALFSATHAAAVAAGLRDIDASIAADNPEGLAYYEAMGFRTYRTPGDTICKRFTVEG